MAVKVNRFDRIKLQQPRYALFGFRRALFPKSIPQTAPGFCKANLVRIRILYDQPFQRVWISANDSETDWAAIVLDEKSVAIKSLRSQKTSVMAESLSNV